MRIFSVFTVITLLFSSTAYSQGGSERSALKRGFSSFRIPNHYKMGPVDISASFDYEFFKGAQNYAYLKMQLTGISLNAIDGTPAFWYEGKSWTGNQLAAMDGLDPLLGFNELRVRYFTFDVKITCLDGSVQILHIANWDGVEQKLMPWTLRMDANNIAVVWGSAVMRDIYFENSSVLTNRIKNAIKNSTSKTEQGTSNNAPQQLISASSPVGKNVKAESKQSSAEDEFWTTGNKTTVAKSQSSSITAQSKLPEDTPPMIMDKEGNHYIKGSDGAYAKTTKENYDEVKQSYYSEKNSVKIAAQQQATRQAERVAAERLNAANNSVLNHIQETQLKDQRAIGLNRTSFYAARAKEETRQALVDLSELSGTFESLEELNEAFEEQNALISEQKQALVENGRADSDARVNAYFNYASDNAQQYKELAGLAGRLLSDVAAKREAEEARKKLEAEKAKREQEFLEAQRLRNEQIMQARVNLRQELVKRFPEGGTPLSSHNIQSSEVYFFTYTLDKNSLDKESPAVSISNVYAVSKYSDGTWPFNTSLSTDLKKVIPEGELTTIGYYTDKEQATQMHDAFVEIATKSNMIVNAFEFKGKVISATSGQTDYWGTGTKTQEGQQRPVSKQDDFWTTGQESK